jgi:hypothetical protein
VWLVQDVHTSTEVALGTSVQDILANVHSQFCGCTRIYGNIHINMEGLSLSRTLDENDFNMLYYLEHITGAFSLVGIPETTRIILPNLRVIQGKELNGSSHAVVIRNVNTGQMILPNLVEISQGSVLVEQSSNRPLCNWASVNWPAIIDHGDIINPVTGNCNPEGIIFIIGSGLAASACEDRSQELCEPVVQVH